MHKLFGFLRRDFQDIVSYRLRLVLNLGGLLVGVFFLFFIGRTFKGTFSDYLSRYGNDYFSFTIIGMAVSTFVSTGLSSLSGQVRDAQLQGTLEALLVTPTSPNTILFGNSLWSFVESFLESVFYLAVAALVIGLRPSFADIALVVAILMLTFLCFLSIGMISAAFIMVFKQGDPINWLFGTSSYFLGGLVFPVEVLPAPLQAASFFLPMTHASRAVREVLLVSEGNGDILGSVVFLAAFALAVGPLGLISMRISLARAKKEGSLVQF